MQDFGSQRQSLFEEVTLLSLLRRHGNERLKFRSTKRQARNGKKKKKCVCVYVCVCVCAYVRVCWLCGLANVPKAVRRQTKWQSYKTQLLENYGEIIIKYNIGIIK